MKHSHKIKIALSDLPKKDWWGSGIVAYQDNDMMVDGVKPNQAILESEYHKLVTMIKSVGLETTIVPFSNVLENEEKFDFIFMRDHFLCNTNKKIVMCNMRLEERLNEGNFVVETMEKSGYIVSYLPNQDCLAEGGEFFYLPKENILLAGLCRNNLKGAESMAELMGVDQLHIIESSGYHLDTAICPIFNNEYDCIGINCAKEVFDDKNYKVLRNLCSKYGWELIDIQNYNQKQSLEARAAMNALTLPGILISGAPILSKKVQDFTAVNNIQMYISSVSQFNLSGGSVHCLTNELF
ncbi:arginine deiminase-related protein [Candidatus Marinimicrobia bacterium]|nr:arginine deiminase-related protein [Candidatus Neomarinimicrobiota bacterium]MDC1000306.1 arginine deiminase-related protein [Candidatus Neomarinimicrobiota bacterium]